MNQKGKIYELINRNLFFFILSLCAFYQYVNLIVRIMKSTIMFESLSIVDVINNMELSVISLKIGTTDVWNYPLIPIFAGIVYNIYLLVKTYIVSKKQDSIQ